jgi:hypothetical protein
VLRKLVSYSLACIRRACHSNKSVKSEGLNRGAVLSTLCAQQCSIEEPLTLEDFFW